MSFSFIQDIYKLTHCFESAGLLSWTDSKQWANSLVSPRKQNTNPLGNTFFSSQDAVFKQSFVCLFSQEFIGLAPKGQDESGVGAFLSTFLSSSSLVGEPFEYFIELLALESWNFNKNHYFKRDMANLVFSFPIKYLNELLQMRHNSRIEQIVENVS